MCHLGCKGAADEACIQTAALRPPLSPRPFRNLRESAPSSGQRPGPTAAMDFDDFDDGFVRPPPPPSRGACQQSPRPPVEGVARAATGHGSLWRHDKPRANAPEPNHRCPRLPSRPPSYISHRSYTSLFARSPSRTAAAQSLTCVLSNAFEALRPRSRWSRAPARVGSPRVWLAPRGAVNASACALTGDYS